MSNSKPRFEQVPLEVVKKLFEKKDGGYAERILRRCNFRASCEKDGALYASSPLESQRGK
jgi:hypothetical protein